MYYIRNNMWLNGREEFIEDGNEQGHRRVQIESILHAFIHIFAVVGIVLFCVQIGFLNSGKVRLPYCVTGVWMSALLVFHSTTALVLMHFPKFKGASELSRPFVFFWKYYQMSTALFSFLLMIGWFFGYRIDGGLWAISLLLLSLINHMLDVDGDRWNIKVKDKCPYKELEAHNMVESSQESLCQCFSVYVFSFLRVLAWLLNGMLLGGCYVQMIGYRSFSPRGRFVSIQVDGLQQRILTQCIGTRDPSVPTIWVEVGGGGHSMSDLWGLQDYIVHHFDRRYCSYDQPGTGWSDPRFGHEVMITEKVMDAMGEPGPFICLGNMDDGDIRCLKYCSKNPENCRAIVPVGFGQPGEFQSYVDYFGGSAKDQRRLLRETSFQRATLGNVINFFGVSWGVIASVVKNPEYEPHDKAHESLFLNLMNEKQWSTNSNFNYEVYCNPVSAADGQWFGPSHWNDVGIIGSGYYLPDTVPVIGFTLGQSEDDLNNQCKLYGYSVGSKDCNYLFFIYNSTIATDRAVVALNNKSKLFICGENCTSAQGNSFIINQGEMIPWFAETLWGAIKDIKV